MDFANEEEVAQIIKTAYIAGKSGMNLETLQAELQGEQA